jgi:hypothetical protein
MRAVARTNASDGLGKYLLGLLFGAGFTTGIDLGKIPGQPCNELVPTVSGEGRRLDNADADLFVFEHMPTEQALDDGLLVSREIFSAADHGERPRLHYAGVDRTAPATRATYFTLLKK